jgi:hypothetical protein
VSDPLFWLGLSAVLVVLSLTAVLAMALPTLQQLSRTAHSAEQLLETLNRELPRTLESLRLTGSELAELGEEVSEGLHSASQVVKQVDHSLSSTRQQARQIHVASRSTWVGLRAAWRTFTAPDPSAQKRSAASKTRDRNAAKRISGRQNYVARAHRQPRPSTALPPADGPSPAPESPASIPDSAPDRTPANPPPEN